MKRFLKFKFGILAMALLVVIGLGCRDRLSDGGTETTNGTVVGMALYANGNIAAGARISLRPSRYLTDINSSAENTGTIRLETKSDEQGRFQLSGIDAGEYAIEINDGKANAAWVNFEMSPSLEKVNLSSNTLLRTATLSGSLKSPGKLEGLLVYIRVFGLERKTFADRDGHFVLQDMPPGSYSLRINVSSPYFDSVTLAENLVSSDSDTKVGEVRLPLQSCANYKCDSLAVKSILDANGKANSVSSVTTKDKSSGRIITLRLTSMGLRVLPEELGSLTALKTLRCQGNKFDSLPQSIVNLPVLEILDLEDNVLQFLPSRLGEVTSLIDLKLTNNKLTTLPYGLGRLQNLKLLSASKTQLRSLPEDITNCKALFRLEVSSDSLSSLPVNMGDLQSLRRLFLDSNQLSNFPESMLKLINLDTLFLNGNKFCNPLSPEMEKWVQSASGDGATWNNRQDCP